MEAMLPALTSSVQLLLAGRYRSDMAAATPYGLQKRDVLLRLKEKLARGDLELNPEEIAASARQPVQLVRDVLDQLYTGARAQIEIEVKALIPEYEPRTALPGGPRKLLTNRRRR